MWSVYRLAARAALWRTTPDVALVDLPSLLGWTIVLAAVRIGLQFLDAHVSAHVFGNFNPYGLNALAAVLAIELAVAGLFVRPGGRVTALGAMFALSVIADIATAGIRLAVPLLAAKFGSNEFWTSTYLAAAGYGAEIIWWIGAMVCVVSSLDQETLTRRLVRIAALWIALFAANAVVPQAPVFAAPDFDVRDANWWEFLRAKYAANYGQAALRRQRGSCTRQPSAGGAAAGRGRPARAAAQRRNRHLRARRCRLGGPGCVRQRDRRRPGVDRQRTADQGSHPSPHQQSGDGGERPARLTAQFHRGRARHRRRDGQGR